MYIYFHLVLFFLITALLFLYSTRKEIKKNNSEQLWYCQTNSNHWKTTFFTRLQVISKRKKCIIRTVLNDQLNISNQRTYVTKTFLYLIYKHCNGECFESFLFFCFVQKKKLFFKKWEINKQTQTKWFFFKRLFE